MYGRKPATHVRIILDCDLEDAPAALERLLKEIPNLRESASTGQGWGTSIHSHAKAAMLYMFIRRTKTGYSIGRYTS